METAYDSVFAIPLRRKASPIPPGSALWRSSVRVAPRAQGDRALEIGCGDGAHTMASALEAPESAFFGFDLAQTAIADATSLAVEAGLANVVFAQRDIFLTTALRRASFDYVVAHGVFAGCCRRSPTACWR